MKLPISEFESNDWQNRPLLWRHFRQPVGAFSLKDGCAIAGAFDSSGSQELRVEIALDSQHIEQAAFKAFGGVALLACGSWLCEWLAGKSIERLRQLKPGELVELLTSQLELRPAEKPIAFLAEDVVLQLLAPIESPDSGSE